MTLLIQVLPSDSEEQPEYLALVDGGNNEILMHSEPYVQSNGLRAAERLSEKIPGSVVQDLRETARADEPPQPEPETEEERAAQEEARRKKEELSAAAKSAPDLIREREQAQAAEEQGQG